MAHNLKSIRQKFKEHGVFYTPPELVEMLYEYVDFDYKQAYDPTCGDGALLAGAKDGTQLFGQELDAEQAQQARINLPDAEIVAGDTLEEPAFMERKFDLVIGNYPFSVKWNSEGKDKDIRFACAPCVPSNGKADYAFILHCLYMLDKGGKCVLLNFPGIGYRGAREGKIRKWLIQMNYVERVVHIPGDTFVDTKIATLLLVLNKHKTTTDIIFEDKQLKKERSVPLKEVEDADYNLSVNTYIVEEKPKEIIDPVALQEQARRGLIRYIKNDLHQDKMVCMLEGWNHLEFVDRLINELKQYKQEVANG